MSISYTSVHGFTTEPLSREEASRIRSIGLIRPTNPGKFAIWDPAKERGWLSVSRLIPIVGLVEGGVSTATVNHRSAEFDQRSGGLPFDPAQLLEDQLRSRLTNSGRTIRLIEAKRSTPASLLQPRQYRHFGFSVDAYLDLVVIEYGYIEIQLGERKVYAPRILAEIKLVSNSGKEVLLSDRLSNLLTDSRHVVSGADPRHCFDSPKEVLNHPQQAIAGIRAATASVSDLIAEAMIPHSSTLFVYGAPKSNLKVDILVDGKPVAAISRSSCRFTTLPPGKHLLRIYVADYDYDPQEGEARVELTVEEGKTYYVRTLAQLSGFAKRRCKVEAQLVSESEGKQAVDRKR